MKNYNFINCEAHDYTISNDCFDADFDDSDWDNASVTEELDTEYCSSDCPADTLIRKLPVKVVGRSESSTVYDCGENTTGYPVLTVRAKRGETVSVRFSEELLPFPKACIPEYR